MIHLRPSFKRRAHESGFTVLELLVYMVLAGVLMASVYQMLIGQSQAYTKQRELRDARGSLRPAAALLAWDLRQASAAAGDLYAISANSIALRSVRGTGIVCVEKPSQVRFGLWAITGDIGATADDSVLIFAAGGTSSSGDDRWRVLKLQVRGTPGSLGVGGCVWSGGRASELAVEGVANVPSDTAGIRVGAPFRAFRRVEYGLYAEDGRWWLGRKVGGAASYEKLTGPLQASGGLDFTYYDASGNVTVDPTQVAAVAFVLRAESYGQARVAGGIDFQRDSLATRVALRG